MRISRLLVTIFITLTSLRCYSVYVSPDGVGQLLLYPYFAAQSVGGADLNTYISVVNERGGAKALRVNVREGRNGRVVGRFNLLIGPFDMWTGAIIPTAEGARIVTTDKTCTDPAFLDAGNGVSVLDFEATSYQEGSAADGFGTDVARLREGYIEVLQMSGVQGSPLVLDCTAFRDGQLRTDGISPVDGISGTLTLINVSLGMDFTTNATAIGGVARSAMFRRASDAYPDLDASEIDPVALFLDSGRVYRATTASGLDAIELILMRQGITNEFVLDPGTGSRTDWVFTFPTKRFRSPAASPSAFATAFIPGTEDIEGFMRVSSREPSALEIVNVCDPSCQGNQQAADLRMPWVSTVWSFRTGSAASTIRAVSDVLGSRNAIRVDVPALVNGWASVSFGRNGRRIPSTLFTATKMTIANGTSTEAATYNVVGLPVLGFMVRTFQNGTINCAGIPCQANYGGLFDHKGQTSVASE